MSTPDLYLATSAEAGGDPETLLLAEHLGAHGVSTDIVAWDDATVDWFRAPLTVIRSTWDYDARRDDFLRWAGSLPLLRNQASLVEWNTDKRYLFDLPPTLPIVPSRFFSAPSRTSVLNAMDELGWKQAVLKPTVGLDGHGVAMVGMDTPWEQMRTGGWILQPLVEEAITEGETSVIVIDGCLTHAVLKTPPPGDFRVQPRLGGRVSACAPSDGIAELALRAVAWIDPCPLYARVDIVRRGETLCLMELELVEPNLYFGHAPDALVVMTDAIRGLLR